MIEQKRKIFEDTLTNAYNLKDYIRFVSELLNNILLVAPNKQNRPYDTFSSAIEYHIHIGNYIGQDNNKVALFAVCLKNDKNLDNARSMQRNYVKSLLQNTDCSGALVAFYIKDDTTKWRLSLVRLDYEFSKGKINEKLTPAKRFSYLVGFGEPCHTAKERLYPLFIADNTNPSLDELEQAFSVEAVTKEFFDRYRDKYLDLKEYLDSNPQFVSEAESRGFNSEQFAKKLMGQIVFLYFIQKKGWLGVNAFPRNLNESEYKSAFYQPGQKPKELMPKVYKKINDEYKLDTNALKSLNIEDEKFLATLFKGDSWGNGPKDFMKQIFKRCSNRKLNFFDDYLEPLFYTGLNQNRGNNAFFAPLHCRIPFLNGGLFEEMKGYDWQNNNFKIPNELFSNEVTKGIEADGILDVFNRYNFTMAEDEPMEREVAIDPEMLGKVFENLLDVKDRKSKGAFYTPREIVHYMCQESLINYLSTKTGIEEADIRKFILYGEYFKDEDSKKTKYIPNQGDQKAHYEFDYNKNLEIPESILSFKNNTNRLEEIDNLLSNVKVVDLAVGSGAFPLGMINEIVKARNIITTYLAITIKNTQNRKIHFSQRNNYWLKRETIKNCIFACDIESSATDITKLRLWLSLVIDDQIRDKEDEMLGYATKPRELPNLDCNIICGNSLMDSFNGIQLITENSILNNISENRQHTFLDNDLTIMINNLIELQSRLYEERDHIEKESLKQQIQDIYNKIIFEQIKGLKKYEDEYYKVIQMPSKPFVLWQLYFPKVFKENGGFDIVIGNPPYIGEEGHKELFQSIANTDFGKKYYIGKMDFWYFFTSKGIELLRDKGIISFIAPNNWMTTAGGKNMRKHIANSTMIKRFLTFNNTMIFESASQQTMIFVLQKQVVRQAYELEFKQVGNRELDKQDLTKFLNSNEIGDCFKTKYIPNENKDGKAFQFLNNNISNITNKICSGKKLYLSDDEIINGIHPHHAEVTKKMLSILENSKIGDGIFILKNSELNQLNLTDLENKVLLKPYYDTNNIGRYYFNPLANKKIIYTTSDFKNVHSMDKYPNLKKHLDKYEKVITSDNKPYGLHRARKKEFFENPKICSLRKCSNPTFSYIDKPAYVTAEWYLIMTNRVNMKYLTSLLNSSLIKFWLLKKGKIQGNIYQVDKEPLIKIPILIPNKNLEDKIISLYDEIVKKKLNDQFSDTLELEELIDKIFYSEYGLNDSEIQLIKETLNEWNTHKK